MGAACGHSPPPPLFFFLSTYYGCAWYPANLQIPKRRLNPWQVEAHGDIVQYLYLVTGQYLNWL
jgi:hypothetical protein